MLSDLHILDSRDFIYALLLSFMRQQLQKGDFLVLAGDIFDLWIGNKPLFLKRYPEFLKALHTVLEKDVQIHYIEGNHDFYLIHSFGSLKGLHIHPHYLDLTLDKTRFYIAHGDTVDVSDWKYQWFRAFLRNPIIKTSIGLTPDTWIEKCGQKGSYLSRTYSSHRTNTKTLYRNFAVSTLLKGFDVVVLGHTHELDNMRFRINNRFGEYWNMGYPKKNRSFLVWNSTQKKMTRETF